MNWWEPVVLGLVQGITEIFPVSSDGHLALIQGFFATPLTTRLELTAALHLGTGLAMLFFFRDRLPRLFRGRAEDRRLLGLIFIASLPAVFAGLFLEDLVAKIFSSYWLIGVFFLLNGTLLFFTRYACSNRQLSLDWSKALLIGLIQVTALLPAISRSGTTIGLALLLGIERREAFEFSFLLAIPITLGAAVLEMGRLDFSLVSPVLVVVAIVVAGAVGFLTMVFLRRLVLSQRFYLFGYYCWLIGLAVLILLS